MIKKWIASATWIIFLGLGAVLTADVTPKQRAAIERLQKLLALNPAHGGLMCSLAEVYAESGQAAEAVSWLRRAVDTGIAVDWTGPRAFDKLRANKEFQELLPRVQAGAVPLIASIQAFAAIEKDIEPEGIAYDPVAKDIYLGSIKKRKIIRVLSDGSQRDFTASGQDGLMEVLGLRVDGARRRLWANANIDGDGAGQAGASGLFQFDLLDGRLIKKYLLDHKAGKHLFNDLVITPDGDVFLTDSESGRIYRLPHDRQSLEVFAGEGGEYNYLNGITVAADGKRLYVSDFLHGLSILEIATKKITTLGHAGDVSTLGIDGLYLYKNTLIGIQNACGMDRILQYRLDDLGEKIIGLKVLERCSRLYYTPMTGALAGHDFYFVANGRPAETNTPAAGQKEPPQVTVVHRLVLD